MTTSRDENRAAHAPHLGVRLAGFEPDTDDAPPNRAATCGIRFEQRVSGDDGCRILAAVVDSRNTRGVEILADALRIGRRVAHDYIPAAIASDFRPPQARIAFAAATFESLAERMARQGRLPLRSVIWTTRQCAMALRELSRAGAGDAQLVPEWIRICPDGRAQLLLWQRGASSPRFEDAFEDRPLTALPWVAADPGSVQSLGRLMYRMLTGRETVIGLVSEPQSLIEYDRQQLLAALEPHPKEFARLVWSLLEPSRHRELQDWTAIVKRLTRLELAQLDHVPRRGNEVPAAFAI